MKRKNVLFGLAVFVIVGVSLSFVAWNAPAEEVLTAQEMKAVIGGLACHYCGSNGDGCADSSQTGTCSLPSCDGSKKTSCKQAQTVCKSASTTATCDNDSAACGGGYKIYSCSTTIVYPASGPSYEECTWGTGTDHTCGGHKTDC